MYAETGLLFPYLQNSPQDFQQLDEFCRTQKSTASIIASPRLRWHCVYVESLAPGTGVAIFFLKAEDSVGDHLGSMLHSLGLRLKERHGCCGLSFCRGKESFHQSKENGETSTIVAIKDKPPLSTFLTEPKRGCSNGGEVFVKIRTRKSELRAVVVAIAELILWDGGS
ncbi:hypothetical protein TB2_022460 [Malus domestica]